MYTDKAKKTFPPKAVTVARWEAAHPQFFVAEKHPDECKCNLCFQRALDALVSKTEEAANGTNSQVDSVGGYDCDQLQSGSRANETVVSI